MLIQFNLDQDLSLCSCSDLSLPSRPHSLLLLTIPEQDQESFSAPYFKPHIVLYLQGRGQFLVLLNQSEQDQESLSALALDCLCQTGLTPWSVSLPFHRTILLFLLLCKILFPGPVGALLCGRTHAPKGSSQLRAVSSAQSFEMIQ